MTSNNEFVYEPLCKARERRLILDTDIGPDCDDAGALAVAFALLRKYRFRLAGVTNCTSNPDGDGAIDAIADYYGISPIPQGRYPKDGFLCGPRDRRYNHCLANEMSAKYINGTLEVALAPALYRKILEEAEAQSVVIVAIGPLNNLSVLLSECYDLVAEKVYAAVVMAGAFPQGKEYNITSDIPAAQHFFERFPRPIICCGYEVGADVRTGFDASYQDFNNPVYRAYQLFNINNGHCLRPSWDPITVLYAIEGEGNFFALSPPGIVRVRDDGTDEFITDPKGRMRYLRREADTTVLENYLNAIIQSHNSKNR